MSDVWLYGRAVNFELTDRPKGHSFSTQQILDLEAVLSPPRFGTYLREMKGDRHHAMELYCWNTDVSAAFYTILQFCELSVRNGAVGAIEAVFGPNWHLNRGFVYTLPLAQPQRKLTSSAQPTFGIAPSNDINADKADLACLVDGND